MSSSLIYDASAKYAKARPDIRPGFTVRVHERIQEGGKERIQVFEGLVIAVHKGMNSTDTTFTVRRIASGVGVERVFALHSPKIEKIEVKKVARVRRAKLFFLRGRRGKAARLSERFTTADEFAVATPVMEEDEAEEVVEKMEAEEGTASEESKESTEESTAPSVRSEAPPVRSEDSPEQSEDSSQQSEETADQSETTTEEAEAVPAKDEDKTEKKAA